MISWDEFRERVRRLKAERWADILASEPPGRAPGRRPRDPEQEALLAEADRRRIAESELLSKARRVPPRPSE
ncbi:MAG: hypothetical protein HOP15_04725 [Planctomycetes bacterium]|nr:hypothetical protein [Planctomycetota bacterium]